MCKFLGRGGTILTKFLNFMTLHGFWYTQEYIYAIFLMLAGKSQQFRLEEVANLLPLTIAHVCARQRVYASCEQIVSEFPRIERYMVINCKPANFFSQKYFVSSLFLQKYFCMYKF